MYRLFAAENGWRFEVGQDESFSGRAGGLAGGGGGGGGGG
jgi:hypothetical protein